MRDYLVAEIEKRRSELTQLRADHEKIARRIETIGVEMGVYADVLQKLNAEQASAGQAPASSGMSAVKPKPKPSPYGGRRQWRGERWLAVVRAAVIRYPAQVTNGEVPAIQAAANQQPAGNDAVRAHVSEQAKAGIYEKLGMGRFRATEAAAQLVGLPLGGGSDAPKSEPPNSGRTLFGAPRSNGAEPLHP